MGKTIHKEARRKAREAKHREQSARDFEPRGGSKYARKQERKKDHARNN